MKRNIFKIVIVMFVLHSPMITSAQWSMVRFDEVNYFTKIRTITPDDAISFGLLSQTSNSFIMRTNNGGSTWDSIPLIVSGNEYMIGSAHFTDVQNGYAGGLRNGFQALVKTNDNGTSWTDVTPNQAQSLQIMGISFVNSQQGYAADQWNIYKTFDGGNNWTSSIPGMNVRDIGFADMNVGYAAGTNSPDATVMNTIDGGQTWNNVLTATIPFFPTSSSMQKIDVINQVVVFVSGQYSNLIFKTLNGGATWDTINLSMMVSIMDFDFISSSKGHAVSDMGEIYSTNDGGINWTLEYAVSGGAYGPSVLLTSLSFSGNTGYVCGSNGLIKKYEVSVGLPEQEISAMINLYPNPVSGNQQLNLNISEDDLFVEIYNADGMLSAKYPAAHTLELTGLQSGVYSIKVIGNHSVKSNRLVLVK